MYSCLLIHSAGNTKVSLRTAHLRYHYSCHKKSILIYLFLFFIFRSQSKVNPSHQYQQNNRVKSRTGQT